MSSVLMSLCVHRRLGMGEDSTILSTEPKHLYLRHTFIMNGSCKEVRKVNYLAQAMPKLKKQNRKIKIFLTNWFCYLTLLDHKGFALFAFNHMKFNHFFSIIYHLFKICLELKPFQLLFFLQSSYSNAICGKEGSSIHSPKTRQR